MEAGEAKKISIPIRVKNAILKLQKNKGVSLVDLKKYLRNEKNLDIEKYNEEIKQVLKTGLDRGTFTRENGFYKMKETKRTGESSTKRRQSKSPEKSAKLKNASRKRSPSQLPKRKKGSVK